MYCRLAMNPIEILINKLQNPSSMNLFEIECCRILF